jgi:dihydroorotase
MQHDLVVEGTVAGLEGLESRELGITDGKISEIRKSGLVGTKRITAERGLIFPGFIDLHVHMREPGWERKEDFRTGSLAALHGGVTTVVDMPNNPKPTTTVEALEEKSKLARSKALVDVKFYGGAEPERLEALARIRDGVVGYKLYLAQTTGDQIFPVEELGRAFDIISKTRRPVSLHCEDQGTIEVRSKNIVDRRAYVQGDIRPAIAEVKSVGQVIDALRGVPGVHANVCHASTGLTLELVQSARKDGLRIDCEVALHHLYFNRKALRENPLLRTNPPLRDESDRKQLVDGLKDGTVSFLVTDHAPHGREEKASEDLSGVPGLDDYSHVVSWLIRSAGTDPATIARAACYKPASFAGLIDRGRLEVGLRADLVVLDIASPETVTADQIRSKCGWSPYEGKEFPGRARWTIRGGEVLVDDYELVA